MFRKKADPELTERLITEFSTRGYLDEHKFAQWLTDVRRRSGKSERAIQAELAKKGVPRDIAHELLTQDDGDELARLRELVVKKQQLSRYKTDQQKLMRYLVGQGFSYSDIKQVLASTSE